MKKSSTGSLMTPPAPSKNSKTTSKSSSRSRARKKLLDSGISAESGHSSQSENIRNFLSDDDEEEEEEETEDPSQRIHKLNSK